MTGRDGSGRLAGEVVRFAGMLRGLGLTVGTGQTLDAVGALDVVELGRRDDVYAALRAVLLDTHAHEPAFAAAFDRFWLGLVPLFEQHAPAVIPPQAMKPRAAGEERDDVPVEGTRRVVVLSGDGDESAGDDTGSAEAPNAEMVAYSASEALRHKDFSRLSPEELAELRHLLARLDFTLPPRRLRRTEAAARGPMLDLRRVARRNFRYGAEVLVLPRRRRKTRSRPLALLCDVSGSMDRYTRLLLRFLHATAQGLDGVETFVFGTRLTRVTHQLRLRDPDRALDEVTRDVLDFSGGTRIGAAIGTFNRRWARRALARGAVTVVISDGWDRGDPDVLAAEMAHLQRSCHLLVWLNPLLGLEGYQPLTRGMSAALPYVDLFLPAHNLASLEALAALLHEVTRTRADRAA